MRTNLDPQPYNRQAWKPDKAHMAGRKLHDAGATEEEVSEYLAENNLDPKGLTSRRIRAAYFSQG